MMSLAWPWLLLIAPLPWILRRQLPAAPSGGAALRVPFFTSLRREPPSGAGGGARGGAWRLRLGTAIWLLLVLAAARPEWVGEPEALPLEGRDIMLALDISGSMDIPDFTLGDQAVTRLDVVKVAASEFIAGRVGDRLGLVLFGSQAYLQTPLTFDRATLQAMLRDATIGLAGKETAIGDAIALALKRLRDAHVPQRILILLTDGANTAGSVDPRRAAELAAQEDLRIYTIGIGADSLRVENPLLGARTVNPSRDLDEGALQAIAKITGGRYFRAKDTAGLQQVYRELDELEPRSRDEQLFRPVQPLFMWPLGLALALSALPVWLAIGVRWRQSRNAPHRESQPQPSRSLP